jgi:hypothetical protein
VIEEKDCDPVTLNIFFDLSICKIILNFIICLI